MLWISFIFQKNTGLRFLLEVALWQTFKGLQHCFRTLHSFSNHSCFKLDKNKKLILQLTEPLQNFTDKEIQFNLKGRKT
jgi:hypothetical protein